MVQEQLRKLISDALEKVRTDLGGDLPSPEAIHLERPRDKKFGDWSTNVAMLLAKPWKRAPRAVAEALVEALSSETHYIEKVEIAGPGFINFHLTPAFLRETVREIAARGDEWGVSEFGEGRKVQVEFVSANPVGPMHLGHGRWAAVGDSLARILEAAGYRVEREFYVNDFGNQMNIFGASVAARYREELGRPGDFPEEGYRGAYITDIAREIIAADGDSHLALSDKEQADLFKERAYLQVLEHLKRTLSGFGVDFDVWYSERTLHESGRVLEVIQELREAGHVYDSEGAVWMQTSALGDEKDRVLIRADGTPTYYAADVAYHADKLDRGFDTMINIWGADHHGYVARMKAAVAALGADPERLQVIIGQLVNLLRAGEPVRMSKRTGEMVTFEELVEEVGHDATRFFFLMRSTDSTVDFDIDLAKQRTTDNPVYYVQYAHARIASIIRTALERGEKMPPIEEVDLDLLGEPSELALLQELSRYPEVIVRCASELAPHKMSTYLRELAEAFHVFYTNCRVIGVGEGLTAARLHLIKATQQTIKNGLALLGISAPDQM